MRMRNRIFINAGILVTFLVIAGPLLIPKIACLLNNRAMEHLDSGRLDEAISLLKRSLKLNSDPVAHKNLADAYQEKGELDSSIAEYKKAIQLDRYYAQAFYELADLYQKRKMYEEAIKCLKKIRPFYPQTANKLLKQVELMYLAALLNEATNLQVQGDQQGGLTKIYEAIEVNPNFSLPHKILGDMALGKDRFQQAVDYYNRAIELGLENAQVYNDLGISYMRLERYRQAVRNLKKAHRIDPLNPGILYNLASTLRDSEDYAEALKYYQQLLETEGDFPNLHNDIAGIYESLGRVNEAKSEYRKEIESAKRRLRENPEDTLSLVGLAVAYNGVGRYEEARVLVNKVLRKDPDYAEALYVRSEIYENLNDWQAAIEDLQRARELFPSADFIDESIDRLKKKALTASINL